jgi:(4-(4-[2-(gamma-L-glutamylamino)ethyl]phenoxymethyl)furan-2-yl)methanamine synthase
MPREVVTGWDVGGAHLKVAQCDAGGRVLTALQLPCRLWLGLDQLERALVDACAALAPPELHGVTMTGELCDLFADRAEGVARIAATMAAALGPARVRVYAGARGFVDACEAEGCVVDVASANWHATAAFVAARRDAGLLVDVGSTTTDIVPFAGGRVLATATTDADRMLASELVYTGVTRTPVIAIAHAVDWDGTQHPLMAEFFATAADIHRLTGVLPPDGDQHATADGRGTSDDDCARRLARMLGRDYVPGELAKWRSVARELASLQLDRIEDAARRVLERARLAHDAPVIGAGAGHCVAANLAERLGRPYAGFAGVLDAPSALRERAATCAPAVAVAALCTAEL